MTVWWSECSLWLEPLRRLKRRRLDFSKLVKMSLLIQEVSAGVRTTEEASWMSVWERQWRQRLSPVTKALINHQPSWAGIRCCGFLQFFGLLARILKELTSWCYWKSAAAADFRGKLIFVPSSCIDHLPSAEWGWQPRWVFFLCLHFSTSDLLKHVRAYMEIQ